MAGLNQKITSLNTTLKNIDESRRVILTENGKLHALQQDTVKKH